MNVIIIEDEPLMAEELALAIPEADPSFHVVAKFGSVQATLEYLANHDLPDLFFSDIQLSDGLSFEIFAQIPSPVPVIFCTAFDQYALDAFKANGIDYMLKPFDNGSIQQTLVKYKKLTGGDDFFSNFKDLLEEIDRKKLNSRGSLIIHQGQKIFSVRYADMRVLYLKNGLLHLVTKESKHHIVSSSLDRLESALGEDFHRVNRQVIIHREAIDYVSSYFARKLLVTPRFKLDVDIVVSKANTGRFLHWLEQR